MEQVASTAASGEDSARHEASEPMPVTTSVSWMDIFFSRNRESEVTLHVYSVGKNNLVLRANKALQKVGTGAFHAGVEVHGTEWSFAAGAGSGSGIRTCAPASDPEHLHYRSITMGMVKHDLWTVRNLIDGLSPQWSVDSYSLLQRNCCHFVDEFLRHLGFDGAPRWLLRSAGLAKTLHMGPLISLAPQMCCSNSRSQSCHGGACLSRHGGHSPERV